MEIDIVIPRTHALTSNWEALYQEVWGGMGCGVGWGVQWGGAEWGGVIGRANESLGWEWEGSGGVWARRAGCWGRAGDWWA